MEYADFISEFADRRPYVYARTSGTTGTPKEICLLKSDMRLSAEATNRFFGIDSGSVLATPLASDFIAGKMMAVRSIVAGCTFLPLPPSNRFVLPPGVDISLLAVVPTQLPALEEHPEWARRVANVLVGGAPPHRKILDKLADKGYNVWVSYGMTETCSHVALAKAEDSRRVFEAMPGIEFVTDARGCLGLIAPERSFKSLQTNDIVDLIDSRHFRWLGRADNVINSGGFKIHPEEIEAALSELMPGLVFYIASEPDEHRGSRAVLYYQSGNPEEIQAAIERAIPDHRMRPKALVRRDIALTPSGKIIRR